MRRTDQVGALALLLFAVGYGAVALRSYPYWGANGPASGFFPVWLALAMAVLAICLFVGARRRPDGGGRWLPRGESLARLVCVVVATALLVALLPVVGMALGAALFLMGVLRFLEGYSWARTIAIAAATAVASHLVFARWLAVPLPVGPLGF